MRTAILVSGDDVVLALQPQTDVERRAVDLATSERSEVTVHRDKWTGQVGGTYRAFQGTGGELVLVARVRPEDPAPQPEDLASVPATELDRDSAPVLQLRRDVKWLRDRGVTGQVSMIPSTIAEMVGLDVSEYAALTLRTRQKFENRAYTALRTLNGGGR